MTHTTITGLKVKIIYENEAHLCEVENEFGNRFYFQRKYLNPI